jgi:hypothetical protein
MHTQSRHTRGTLDSPITKKTYYIILGAIASVALCIDILFNSVWVSNPPSRPRKDDDQPSNEDLPPVYSTDGINSQSLAPSLNRYNPFSLSVAPQRSSESFTFDLGDGGGGSGDDDSEAAAESEATFAERTHTLHAHQSEMNSMARIGSSSLASGDRERYSNCSKVPASPKPTQMTPSSPNTQKTSILSVTLVVTCTI